MNYKIYNDDCLKVLDTLEENSIDSIEKESEYCDIAKARIEFAINQKGENKNE